MRDLGLVILDGELRFCEGEKITFSALSMHHQKEECCAAVGYGRDTKISVRFDGVVVRRAGVNHLHDLGAHKAAMALVIRRCREALPAVYGRNIQRGEICPSCGRSLAAQARLEQIAHAEDCRGVQLFEDIRTTLKCVGAVG